MAAKEKLYPFNLTRPEVERLTAFAQLGINALTQQMAQLPEEQLDRANAMLKANKALQMKLATPLIEEDEAKAKAGPLADPPAGTRRDRRAAASRMKMNGNGARA